MLSQFFQLFISKISQNLKMKFFIILIAVSLFPVSQNVYADVPNKPSYVYVKDRQLFVGKRLKDGSLDILKPYLIKGLTWLPATRSPDNGPNPFNPLETVPYGLFFDWPGRDPQGHVVFIHWLRSQYLEYLTDIDMMRRMNINTVRVYTDFGDNPAVYKKILDEFYRNDIMVIMTIASSRHDIDKARYKKVLSLCMNHPSVLMWSLGNEWNLEYNKYWGYDTVRDAADATDHAASEIKNIDCAHPVSSCLGDRFYDDEVTNTIAWIVERCVYVDVWGLNIYRGEDFSNLFKQWKSITDKPMYISEFGIDSLETKSYKKFSESQVYKCVGNENQDVQGEYAICLWNDLAKNLSILDSNNPCIGGTLHSFNDHLWKVGSYHVNLGGLVNCDDMAGVDSFRKYDAGGFYLPSSPDSVINEEYYGVVDADRQPKKVYWRLKSFYKKLGAE